MNDQSESVRISFGDSDLTAAACKDRQTRIRKILVSVKFVSAILGPERAAPILWAPRISAFFLQESPSCS